MKSKLDGKSSITMLIVGGILGLGISGMIYGIKWDQKIQETKIWEEDSFNNSKKQSKIKSYKSKEWSDNEWENEDWDENDWEEWGEDVGEYWGEWGKNVGEYWSHYGQELASNITNDVMDSVKKSMTFEKDCLLSRQEAEQIARKYIEEKTGKNLEKCEIDLYLNKWSGWVNQGEWRGSIIADETTRYGFTVDVESEKVTEFNTYTRNKKGESWKSKNSSGQIEQIIDEKLSHFDKVEVNIDSQINVCLTEGKDYGIKHYQLGEKYKLNYEVKGNTLYISQNIKDKHFDYNHQEDWLCVTVPKDTMLNSIEIKEGTGNVEVLNTHAQKMKINVDAGNINVEDSTVDELSVNVSTGNAFVNETKLEKGLVKTDTGNLFIEDIEAMNILEAKVETGNIFLDGSLKGSISAHANTGNVFNDSKENKDCNLDIKANGKNF